MSVSESPDSLSGAKDYDATYTAGGQFPWRSGSMDSSLRQIPRLSWLIMFAKSASALSVLVVEDQEDAAQSVTELLTLWGYSARMVISGAAALEEVATVMPDVILLDIGLPEMDGWQVAVQIRERAVGKQPFIVAVTGYGEEGDRWRSADAGVDMHLVKPVTPAALAKLLQWVHGLLRPATGADR